MKLTDKAIEKIDNLDSRLAIAKTLRFSETWIRTLINRNKPNGDLTTAAVLKVIQQETGLSQEEILTEEVDSVESAKVIQD